jgi:hypothetical protein
MRKLTLALLILSASCGMVRTGEEELYKYSLRTTIIESVENCESLLKKESLRPQVCGRCKITFEPQRNRLVIAETDECVPYNAYGCYTTFGDTFIINTVSCKPLTEKLPRTPEQPIEKKEQKRQKGGSDI